jgi:hypothetical protein
MHRSCLLLGFLLVTPSAFGQTSPSDSQTLQALLLEVQQLHKDLQTNAATTLRTQILFFRIQTQQTAVTDASRRVDEIRSKVVETLTERKKDEAQSKQIQDALEKEENSTERKNFEGMVRYYRNRLQELSEQEQQQQAKQIEAEDRLRLEQAKLDTLMARLEEIERTLPRTQ